MITRVSEVIREQLGLITSLDEQLNFLTEVFLLSEEIRYELVSNEEIQKGRKVILLDKPKRKNTQVDTGLSESTEGNGEI
jgi:hypothetical protein